VIAVDLGDPFEVVARPGVSFEQRKTGDDGIRIDVFYDQCAQRGVSLGVVARNAAERGDGAAPHRRERVAAQFNRGARRRRGIVLALENRATIFVQRDKPKAIKPFAKTAVRPVPNCHMIHELL
jgi:hypothetical protein